MELSDCFDNLFCTVGYVLLTISTPNTSWLMYPACIFIGVAGLGLHTTNLQTANFSKPFRSSIVTLLHGLFDSSVIVFLLVKKGCEAGTDLHLIFLILTCLSIFLWMRTYLLLPRKTIPFPLPPGDINFGWKEIRCFKSKDSEPPKITSVSQNVFMDCNDNNSAETERGSEDVTPSSFTRSLKNYLFWTNILHYSVVTLRLSFQINCLLSWLESFSDPNQISELNDDFNFILMFGAVASPINGLVIDGLRKILKAKGENIQILNLQATCVSLLITSFLSIIMSITALVLSPHGTFIFFLFTRSFVHGSCTAFIVHNFPFKDFGKFYGLVSLSAGVSSLLQYPIFQLSLSYDPTFYYINIGFLVAALLTLLHPTTILVKIMSMRRSIKERQL